MSADDLDAYDSSMLNKQLLLEKVRFFRQLNVLTETVTDTVTQVLAHQLAQITEKKVTPRRAKN